MRSAAQLSQAFDSARAEAFKAFGDPTVFMEQLVDGARHVEVQIIADHYGTTWAAGVRDCTIQRRHQKILEEAPSPALSPEQDQALREAAVRLSQAAGYHNAGTVEFLYEPESKRFSFMEMNTRLQVEHPVTECTTGLDLVKLQIHVARGGRLEGEPPRTTGHAIEVRLNAEDPDNGFAPAPGAIERFRILTGPGVRVDTGVAEGDAVPAEFDSMIAKIIAYGQNRKEALSRLQRALRESVVVIKGGASNKAFLLELLNRPEVQRGEARQSDGWIAWRRTASTSPGVTPTWLWCRPPSKPTMPSWPWSRRSSMPRPCAGGRRCAVRWAGLRNYAIEAIPTRLRLIASARGNTAWRWMGRASMPTSTAWVRSNIGSRSSGGAFTSSPWSRD